MLVPVKWCDLRYRMVTLLEIIKVQIAIYNSLGNLEGMLCAVSDPSHLFEGKIGGRGKIASIKEMVRAFLICLEDADMPLAVLQGEKAIAMLENVESGNATYENARIELKDFTGRIRDYLSGRTAFAIPGEQRVYFDEPLKGWDRVADAFPLAVDDIEEASKCLALGRDTACVYHLSGVVQLGLEALASKLKIKLNPHADTWNKLLVDIDNALKARQAALPRSKWKRVEAFYAEIVSDIKVMKIAWRNPTMHFRRTYTHEQAVKVYNYVREFMIHASTELRGHRKV